MIYVMSDLHGCYGKYVKMLEKIQFRPEDRLYVLGDVVDRGPEGLKMLLDLSARENVILIIGNHDYEAGILLSNLYKLDEEECPEKLIELYGEWLSDGGKSTLSEYLKLSEKQQQDVIRAIQNMKQYDEIAVNDKRYLLSHTAPSVERAKDYKTWTLEECILGYVDYEDRYFNDMQVVTGHTPTGLIEGQSSGRIWRGNGHIAIDCGAVFGKTLGCLCLDTMEEFYVV